jgi:hypothetical protein
MRPPPLLFSSDLTCRDDITRIRFCPDTRALLYAYAIGIYRQIQRLRVPLCPRVRQHAYRLIKRCAYTGITVNSAYSELAMIRVCRYTRINVHP